MRPLSAGSLPWPARFEHASTEARCLELGKSDETSIDREFVLH